MNGLPRCVNSDLPKNEFIRNLVHLPTSELLQHRLALFREACNKSLVSPDYVNLQLVGRKDTAIKPASFKLSEDIWTIKSCIGNMENIPRTLFKNGKRSKTFLSQVSQISHDDQNHSHPCTSPPHSLISSSHEPSEHEPPVLIRSDPPSSSSIANFFVSRELNHLKDMKVDIAAALRNRQDTNTSTTDNIGHELVMVKNELTTLREAVSRLSSSSHDNQRPDIPIPTFQNKSTVCSNLGPTHLKITTWNCRGYKNAIPYLSNLLEDNPDIIALSEHWLWPFELADLNTLHPDYTSFGQADKRLDEHSLLNRGCGGVGFIWKKCLLSNTISMDSDRICGLQINLTHCTLSILCVYLPSTDHDIDEYKSYLKELECAIGAFQSERACRCGR